MQMTEHTSEGLIDRSRRFTAETGRSPRILLVDMENRGDVKIWAAEYARIGFDVDIGPVVESPDIIGRMAVENDVHIIGVITNISKNESMLRQAIERALAKEHSTDIRLILIEPDTDKSIKGLSVLNACKTLSLIGA